MAKNVFCDTHCKYEATGYKLEDIDLGTVIEEGIYLIGDNCTDTNGSITSLNDSDVLKHQTLKNYINESGTTGTYEVTQILELENEDDYFWKSGYVRTIEVANDEISNVNDWVLPRSITSGTADPVNSDGNDGDIYFQYEA